jgi:hypothetical protein
MTTPAWVDELERFRLDFAEKRRFLESLSRMWPVTALDALSESACAFCDGVRVALDSFVRFANQAHALPGSLEALALQVSIGKVHTEALRVAVAANDRAIALLRARLALARTRSMLEHRRRAEGINGLLLLGA